MIEAWMNKVILILATASVILVDYDAYILVWIYCIS